MKIVRAIITLAFITSSYAFNMHSTIEKYKKKKVLGAQIITTKEFIRTHSETEPDIIDIMRIKNKITGETSYLGILSENEDLRTTKVFKDSKYAQKKWLKLRVQFKNQKRLTF